MAQRRLAGDSDLCGGKRRDGDRSDDGGEGGYSPEKSGSGHDGYRTRLTADHASPERGGDSRLLARREAARDLRARPQAELSVHAREGGGGRFPIFTFERTRASSALVNTSNAYADQFARFSTNAGDGKGGIGPGDSGGPAFMDDGRTIAAIGSHGPSRFGNGEVYFTRLDTEGALTFVGLFG